MALTLDALVTLVKQWDGMREVDRKGFLATVRLALADDEAGLRRNAHRLAMLAHVLLQWQGLAQDAGDQELEQEIDERLAFVAEVHASAPTRSTRPPPRAKDVLGELPDDEIPDDEPPEEKGKGPEHPKGTELLPPIRSPWWKPPKYPKDRSGPRGRPEKQRKARSLFRGVFGDRDD